MAQTSHVASLGTRALIADPCQKWGRLNELPVTVHRDTRPASPTPTGWALMGRLPSHPSFVGMTWHERRRGFGCLTRVARYVPRQLVARDARDDGDAWDGERLLMWTCPSPRLTRTSSFPSQPQPRRRPHPRGLSAKLCQAWRMSPQRRHELTDDQWQRLAPLRPPQRPCTGRPARDHRTVLNGIVWILRTWRALARSARPVWAVDDRVLPVSAVAGGWAVGPHPAHPPGRSSSP